MFLHPLEKELPVNPPLPRKCLPLNPSEFPVTFCGGGGYAGLEIISRLAPVKLSGQTYFCSDTTHFWPDKSPLRHISTKFPPSPCSMMFTYQTSTFSKPLLYMEPRTHCRKSGMHGTATTFGKINITFVHASIASVLCLLYR